MMNAHRQFQHILIYLENITEFLFHIPHATIISTNSITVLRRRKRKGRNMR